MNGVLIRGGKNKIGIIVSRMLAGAAALAIFAGLGIVTRADAAASRKATRDLLLREMSVFDPFTLQSISISAVESGRGTEGDSDPIILLGTGTASLGTGTNSFGIVAKSRPPIRIPYRPPLRSPFRPPL